MSGLNAFHKTSAALSVLDSSQQAYSAALTACLSYPQGTACQSLPALERQLYQCTAGATSAGAEIPGGLKSPKLPATGIGTSSQSPQGADATGNRYNDPRYPIFPSPGGGSSSSSSNFYSPGYNR
jgi:hypothetical protein